MTVNGSLVMMMSFVDGDGKRARVQHRSTMMATDKHDDDDDDDDDNNGR